MNNLLDMVWIELRKVLRSRVPLFTALGAMLMPFGIGFLIFLARNPQLSHKLGLVSAKANLVAYSTTNWPTYMGLYGQIIAAGGFFLFVFAISWVFGREFVDGTLKDLLAVPVPRATILLAKFIVVVIWSAALTVLIFVLGLITGALIQLPQFSLAAILQSGRLVAISAGLAIAAVLPFALFASLGRGYLLPMGAALVALLLANLVMVTGWGEFFPWSIPLLYSQGKGLVTPAGFWIVLITGGVGMLATHLWWKYADQSR